MKKLLTLFAFTTLLSPMPLTAWAQNTVSTITTTENITKTSTVYVGEVIVDGESQIKYLYSNDVSINNIVIQNLLVCLEGMADSDYATLLEGHEFDYDSLATGFAICSNPDLVATMGENWSSAQYVGTLYYPDKTVTSEINSNLYDIDEGFKAALDAQTEERNANIDTPVDAEKCFVSHLDVRSSTDVWYTIEDGQVVRHSDITIVHDSEATTVIYTKVELASGSTSTVLGDVDGDGTVSVTDVAWIVSHILGVGNNGFIAANADINDDGEIDINDVMATVSIILEGDNTPQVYLACPDDNHPHLIDLGLPSGTKWACCNVGAKYPEEYGGYYAWGETEEKIVYYWDDYQYGSGYNNCQYLGSDIAGTQYDVAHVEWKSHWQMPTRAQFDELLNNCNIQWTNLNGINGHKFTGSNNGSIFFPAAGMFKDSAPYGVGAFGYYWSSTWYGSDLDSGYACTLNFYQRGLYTSYDFRNYGKSVRPVVNP